MTRPFDIQGVHRFRRDLMHTVFEVILAPGPDSATAEQAAHEAFRTAENLESEFSRFLPNSDVSRINRLGAGQSVRVSVDTFECLRRGLELQRITGGAFDMAAGALKDGQARTGPARKENGDSGPCIVLNEETLEVGVTEPVTLDLGGIGKGYAVDRMASVLKEWDVASALVHAGRSSVFAWGGPQGSSGWPVTLHRPSGRPDSGTTGADADRLIGRIELNGRAMAASGLEKGPHIIDPQTGLPVRGRIAAWAFADDAATADGLSTAFMVMEPEAVLSFCRTHPDVQAVLVTDEGEICKSDGPESPLS